MTVREVLTTIKAMDEVLDGVVFKVADESQCKHDCYIVQVPDMCTIRSIFHEYKNLLLNLEIKEKE